MELIKVTPIEYGKTKIRRYYSYEIKTFTIEEIYAYIGTKNFAATPKIWQEEGYDILPISKPTFTHNKGWQNIHYNGSLERPKVYSR